MVHVNGVAYTCLSLSFSTGTGTDTFCFPYLFRLYLAYCCPERETKSLVDNAGMHVYVLELHPVYWMKSDTKIMIQFQHLLPGSLPPSAPQFTLFVCSANFHVWNPLKLFLWSHNSVVAESVSNTSHPSPL